MGFDLNACGRCESMRVKPTSTSACGDPIVGFALRYISGDGVEHRGNLLRFRASAIVRLDHTVRKPLLQLGDGGRCDLGSGQIEIA